MGGKDRQDSRSKDDVPAAEKPQKEAIPKKAAPAQNNDIDTSDLKDKKAAGKASQPDDTDELPQEPLAQPPGISKSGQIKTSSGLEISPMDDSVDDAPHTHGQEDLSRVSRRLIEDEMKSSYLDYAMSVIIGRALPDVRDGLKPVHRRILFAMNDMGMHFNKPSKKSARIVGEVLGKYHPHGDTAVYDTLVRMAQYFSLRYMLIQGQGNFGSIDGDNAAAMRYCITGGSLVLTDKGLLPIKDIANFSSGGKAHKKEADISLKVCNYQNRKVSAVRFFDSGLHKTIKLSTEQGYCLEGSYNHPVLTWSDEGGVPHIKWKLLEEITDKDYVILSRRSALFSSKDPDLGKYHQKYPSSSRVKAQKLPDRMSKELAFLLGALTAEGSFHQDQILFNNSDMEYYGKVKDAVYRLFPDVMLYERKMSGCNCLEFSIYYRKIVDFLRNIGLSRERSDKKLIPHTILASRKETIAEFLRGLFEGDGSVVSKTGKRHKGRSMELTYNSKSSEMIGQLKTLLLNFGIVTTSPYQDKRNGCYKLIISDAANIMRFCQEIGFACSRKNSILADISKINPDRMSKNDFIPFLNDYLRRKYSSSFIQRNNFDRFNKLRANLKSLEKHLDAGDRKLILGILKSDHFYNKVSAITKSRTPKRVYSIKVDSSCHSFVADGFINHNTEARLSKIAGELLVDIDKDTINFVDNFDGSLKEPEVLPSKLPNLLINGSSGIAVGMATSIPPHNLREVCDVIAAVIDNPEVEAEELMSLMPGPDFPTGGIIMGRSGILSAYKNGYGKIRVRARTHVEEIKKDKLAIIIDEIPYMVNKSMLIEEIAGYVRDKVIIGISDMRDESDKRGMRVVLELKRDANQEILLNQLFKHTRMQTTFSMNLLALHENSPKVMGLHEIVTYFIRHRRSVVIRRTTFELNKAKDRVHILEGLVIALDNIDPVIALIKRSGSVDVARNGLMENFRLSEKQAQAILDMRLQKLTSLETEKIHQEHASLLERIRELEAILGSEARILEIIRQETLELKEKYGDERKTQIMDSLDDDDIDIEDLITPEEVVVTVTRSGYMKRIGIQAYKSQRRGGKGIIATTTKEEDIVDHLFVANTHDYLLLFTDAGHVHWLKVYKIPESGRYSGGKAIVNLLDIPPETKITSYIKIRKFDEGHFLFMATKKGTVKKTSLMAYSRPRAGGIIGLGLEEGDSLVNVVLTDGDQQILLATGNGNAVKFHESDVREMGRPAKGVRGIRLRGDDQLIGMVKADDSKTLLTITANGYGKRTKISEYRLINRGGSGVRNIICSERNGKVVSVKSVDDDDEIMIISRSGIIIRTPAQGISVIGRNTQGMRLMRLNGDDSVVDAAKIVSDDEPEKADESENGSVRVKPLSPSQPPPTVSKIAMIDDDGPDADDDLKDDDLKDDDLKDDDPADDDELSDDESQSEDDPKKKGHKDRTDAASKDVPNPDRDEPGDDDVPDDDDMTKEDDMAKEDEMAEDDSRKGSGKASAGSRKAKVASYFSYSKE